MSVAPGWYKDPADPTTQRYWDGEGWIGHRLPADVEAPPGPPPAEDASVTPPAAAEGDQTAAPTPVSGGAPPTYPPPTGAVPPYAGPAGGQSVAPFPPGPPPGAGLPPGAGTPPGGGLPPGQPPPGWVYAQHPHYVRLPTPRPHGLQLATPGARLIARLIDIGVLALLTLAVNGWFIWQYFLEIAPSIDAWERYITRQTTELPEQGSPRSGYLQIAMVLVTAALWLAYEVPAVANTGQTFGKRVLGIKVVRLEEPGPLGFGRSLRRWNTLGLPTLLWPCCIGFVLQFVDAVYLLADRPLQQSLHDKSARTVVVRVEPADPAPGRPASGTPGPADGPTDGRQHPTDSSGGPA